MSELSPCRNAASPGLEPTVRHPSGKSRQVLFIWRQTELGEWWLDGERMLNEPKSTKNTGPAGGTAE